MVDETCGYVGRMLTLATATTALVLSIVAAANCHFLMFENYSNEPWVGLEPPFDVAFHAYAGIFSFQIMNATDDSTITDGCVAYDGIFGSSNYEAIITAQVCAIMAPILGVLALFISCVDTFCCRFICSFLISSALFVAACGVQAGTFSLFAEPAFCLDGDQQCDVGISVYMSGIASALYFCACLFLCCFPTPDPVFGKKEVKTRPPSGGGQNVVVQPIIVENRGGVREVDPRDENYYYDEDEQSQSQSKKSKISYKADKVTDEDFNFDAPSNDAARVDYKEITLPDGTRKVEETTYHPDGTTSKKTRKYKSKS